MVARFFLGFQALIFIPYGLYCLVQPQMLADGAGLTGTTVTGIIELQTMYGGLQTAVGVLCALGAAVERYRGAALMALLFIFAGLAVPRVSLALMHGEFTGYTVFAMVFESVSLMFLLWLMVIRGDDGGSRVAS
jgi:hypothetical protein